MLFFFIISKLKRRLVRPTLIGGSTGIVGKFTDQLKSDNDSEPSLLGGISDDPTEIAKSGMDGAFVVLQVDPYS